MSIKEESSIISILSILLLCFLWPSNLSKNLLDWLIIWNVGQGQFVTWVQKNRCIHFDAGGEYFPSLEIIKYCKSKKNLIFISHSDYDHINFIPKLKKITSQLCQIPPQAPIYKLNYNKFFQGIPFCKTKDFNFNIHLAKQGKIKSVNQSSRIVENKLFWISGDATKKMEKSILHLISPPIKYYIVGHHGSKTSSSNELLTKFNFKLAIASSRKEKYGHPHFEVLQKLKHFKIPMIETNNFGHIKIQL